MVFAVNAGAVACPAASVNTTFDPPKLPDAPLPGAVNVTCAPCTGALAAFVTNTWSPVPKDVLTVALCGVPALAVAEKGDCTTIV